MDDLIAQAESKMKKALQVMQQEFTSIRTGRANPALLDRITVEYYGTPTPIKQLALIGVPDARTLSIQPYDRSSLGLVEKAIQKSDLGMNPSNDGTVIRLSIPMPTEERRKELVKTVKKLQEEAKVAVRNVRREAQDAIKKEEKDGLPADESKRLLDQLQKTTDRMTAEAEKLAAQKEAEILES